MTWKYLLAYKQYTLTKQYLIHIQYKTKRKKKKEKKNVAGGADGGAVAKESSSESAAKMKVTVYGDSMVRNLPFNHPSLSVNLKCLPGATLASLKSKVPQFSAKGEAADIIIVHAGTNSLQAGTFGNIPNQHKVLRDAGELLQSLRAHNPSARLVMSGVIFRRRFQDDAVSRVNEGLEKLTVDISNTRFVDPNSWLGADALDKDGLHLNLGGKKNLADLFTRIALSSR